MSYDFLAGSTGFVGSNLAEQHQFSGLFCSRNISKVFGMKPDLLVYAAVRSEMFTANKYPEEDRKAIAAAQENISRIAPRKLVLISTVAVYPDTSGVDEDTEIDSARLLPYGVNRYALEKWAENNIRDCLIIRLPALFGKNLRKNFIYDMIHVIPALLTQDKFSELAAKCQELENFYTRQDNGFMKCRELNSGEADKLKNIFRSLGFTALNFTDSRSVYQFYSLSKLWAHIEIALAYGIRRLNLATPPVSAGMVYRFLTGETFINELGRKPFCYDVRTKYYELFGGSDGYIMSLEQELEDLRNFAKEYVE